MVALGVAAVVLVLLERLPATRVRPARLLRPHFATDAAYLATGWIAGAPLAAWWIAAASASVAPWTPVPAVVWPAVPFLVQVTVSLVVLDLGNYLVHWALHRWDVLWALHEAHHSSRELDWMATFRSHVLEQVLRRGLAPLGLVVLGVPAPAVGVAAGVFLTWAMLNHANVRLPLAGLESVLVTPRLHRLHHVPATTERNLGTLLTAWDRLRGTLVVGEPAADAALGLPVGRDTYPQDWAGQLVAPWRRGRAPASTTAWRARARTVSASSGATPGSSRSRSSRGSSARRATSSSGR